MTARSGYPPNRNRGFYDFRVISAVAELATDKNGFVVTYTLEEGREYKFGKISVETELQKLDKDLLTALVPIRSGEIYQDERIETATDALTFAAGAAGFASVGVRPQYKPNRETGLQCPRRTPGLCRSHRRGRQYAHPGLCHSPRTQPG